VLTSQPWSAWQGHLLCTYKQQRCRKWEVTAHEDGHMGTTWAFEELFLLVGCLWHKVHGHVEETKGMCWGRVTCNVWQEHLPKVFILDCKIYQGGRHSSYRFKFIQGSKMTFCGNLNPVDEWHFGGLTYKVGYCWIKNKKVLWKVIHWYCRNIWVL